MVHYSVCPLCSSDKICILFDCTDYFVSKEVFTVCRCNECSFCFTQDRPEASDAGKYYESDTYISHSDTSEGLINKVYRFARNMMLTKKVNIVKRLTGLDNGRILDIGSGTGYFLSEMKKAGWDAKGIEINEKARQFSISSFELEVFDPSQIGKLVSRSFDCITLWHVLEHFHEPYAYMTEIKRLLKPGGTCIIALPNCDSYDAFHYGKYWAAWDVPRHLWHFTSSTFGMFSEKTGFNLNGLRSLPLDVFYISALSEKYKGSKLNFIIGMIRGMWWWLLTLYKKERASSLIYILTIKS